MSTTLLRTRHTTMPSALGRLTLVRDPNGLRGLYFANHWYRPDAASFGPESDTGLADAVTQIGQYLDGSRREFELALAPAGDEFQHRVWELVQRIPYGATATYGELAAQLGADATPQQVGAAVGRNPLCLLIPCHRVVGSGGKLTGYAGGLTRKRLLLDLERDQLARTRPTPLQLALSEGFWTPC